MENQSEDPPSRPAESRPRAPRKTLSLGNIHEGENFDLELKSKEHADDRAARLRREAADAEHERRKDELVLRAVLVLVGLVSLVSRGIVMIPGAPPENAKWASTLLTTIISAGVGYMTGKSRT